MELRKGVWLLFFVYTVFLKIQNWSNYNIMRTFQFPGALQPFPLPLDSQSWVIVGATIAADLYSDSAGRHQLDFLETYNQISINVRSNFQSLQMCYMCICIFQTYICTCNTFSQHSWGQINFICSYINLRRHNKYWTLNFS